MSHHWESPVQTAIVPQFERHGGCHPHVNFQLEKSSLLVYNHICVLLALKCTGMFKELLAWFPFIFQKRPDTISQMIFSTKWRLLRIQAKQVDKAYFSKNKMASSYFKSFLTRFQLQARAAQIMLPVGPTLKTKCLSIAQKKTAGSRGLCTFLHYTHSCTSSSIIKNYTMNILNWCGKW